MPPATENNSLSAEAFQFQSQSEADTDRLGRALASVLPNGSVVALIGTLGAGKTRLVQAIASASGVDPAIVVSPTFVLVHEYDGSRPVYHFDAYRLKDDDEFLALGPEEYFDSQGITLVEWADRVERCLPPSYVEVRVDVTGPTQRAFTVQAVGSAHHSAVAQLPELLPG
jgi:tRNA threonylcarbamoyladenosine biosynthesis protein TsaE